MGIRGVDIQIAISRVADTEKIQQGELSQTRAAMGSIRDDAAIERTRQQEQPQKPEQGDQVSIQYRRKRERQDTDEQEDDGTAAAQGDVDTGPASDPREAGLDILA